MLCKRGLSLSQQHKRAGEIMHKTINTTQATLNGVSTETAKEWIDHRWLKKAKPTQRAFDRMMKKAASVALQLGMKPDQVIEYSIDRGWLSIEADWIKPTTTTRRSLIDDLTDQSWAH